MAAFDYRMLISSGLFPELLDLVNSVIILLSQMTLLRLLTFLLGSLSVTHSFVFKSFF